MRRAPTNADPNGQSSTRAEFVLRRSGHQRSGARASAGELAPTMIRHMRGLRWRALPRSEASPGRAVFVYAAVWLVAGAAVVGVIYAIFGAGDAGTVAVPPVRETQLDDAATRGGCMLRTASA